MLRTRREDHAQPGTRVSEAINRMGRRRKRLFGLTWGRGQKDEDTGLETMAEQLEMLSKIDWSMYRGD